MKSKRGAVALSGVILSAIVVAMIVLPPIVLRDQAAPERIAPYVDVGRADLRGNIGVAALPHHLRFIEARCRTDGGVMLVYEQWAPPYLNVSYAYVMSGQWPPKGWGGGVNSHDLADDPEVLAFFGSSEIPCR